MTGGSGLGLAIVKHIAQAHGGSVTVQSKLEEGSVFRVLLPTECQAPFRATDTGDRQEVAMSVPVLHGAKR